MNPKQKKGPAQPLISNTYSDSNRDFKQISPAITAMMLFVLMTAWSLGGLGKLPVYAEEIPAPPASSQGETSQVGSTPLAPAPVASVQVDTVYGIVRIPSNLAGAHLLVHSTKLATDDIQGYCLQVTETGVQFERVQVAKAFAVSLTKRGQEVEAAKLIQSGCYFQISLPTGLTDLNQEDYALYQEADGIWKKVSSWEILDRTQGNILVHTGSLSRWALVRLKKVAQIHPANTSQPADPSHNPNFNPNLNPSYNPNFNPNLTPSLNPAAQVPCYVPIPLAVAGREGPQLVEPNKKPGDGSTGALPETGERSYTPYVLINALLAVSLTILQAFYRKNR